MKRSVSLRNDRPTSYFKFSNIPYSGTLSNQQPVSSMRMSEEKTRGSVSDHHQTGAEIAQSVASGVAAASSTFQHHRFISKVYSSNHQSNRADVVVNGSTGAAVARMVEKVASQGSSVNVMNSREFGLLPSRPITVSATRKNDCPNSGSVMHSNASIVSTSSTSSVSSMASMCNHGKFI